MSCTLATLAACFSLSGLYIEGAVFTQDSKDELYQWSTRTHTLDWGTETVTTLERVDDTRYGRLTVGWSVDFSAKWSAGVEAFHRSSVQTSRDSGVQGFGAWVRFRPFARE
jgi:hypothetical protein